MTRIPEIKSRDEMQEDKRHIFDEIVGTRGRVVSPFALLLHSPEVAQKTAHLGTYLRYGSTLPPALRELAISATAREWDNDYEWAAHSVLALREGARQEALDTISYRRNLDGLTSEEAAIVKYTRELMQNRQVSEEAMEAVKCHFGLQGLVDLTATIGYYSMIACVLFAFEAEQAPGAPLLP